MFEYLMPNLIMPVYRDTLLYESSKFCVYAQKRKHTPWGVSESAFFALDPSQSYSYKAHGVGDLALKRGMDKEKVIAPYATFLALPMDVSGSVQNLKKLERLGAKGKYGFYEALDYTQSRRGKKQFALVKTYMAHHLGMSFLALHSVLTDHQMAKRFLRDRQMAAFSELLQEKVPIGQVVIERSRREVPEKPKRLVGEHWARVHDDFSVSQPNVAILSNGVYSVAFSDSGHSRSMAGDKLMTRFEPAPDGTVQGMGFYLQTDKTIFPLQAAPEYDTQATYQAEFSMSHAVLRMSRAEFQSEMTLSLPQDMMGERRSVTVKNTTNEPLTGHLVCYAEPVMLRAADYFAHPAFAKLSMETSMEENSLVVHRRSNGQRPDMYLALSVSEDFRFDTSREKAVGRSGLYAAFSKTSESSLGTVLDPCLLVKVPLVLRAGEEKQVQFSLVFGEKREEVLSQSKAVLGREKLELEAYMEEKIHTLRLGRDEWEKALDLAAKIIYPHVTAAHRGRYITERTEGGRALWPYGISGDVPLVTIKLGEEAAEGFLEKQLRQHSFLKKCGIQYDLVLLIADSGDYRRPVFTAVDDVLREMGLEHAKGEKAGIHLLENEGDLSAVYAASVEIYEDGQQMVETSTQNIRPYFHERGNVVGEEPVFSYTANGEVQIQTKGNLPPNTWSHMLASEEFGFIATESGIGHMWQKNARENQITPWANDTLTTKGVERLCLVQDGKEISLFADDDGKEAIVTYGFGYAVWEKEIGGQKVKTTAFVPKGTDARVMMIEADFSEDVTIDYFAKLKLGESETNRRYVITGEKEGLLWAKNGANVEFPDTKVTLCANVMPEAYTTNCLSWSGRVLDGKIGAGGDPCFHTRYSLKNQLVIVIGTIEEGHVRRLTNPDYAKKELEMTKTWWQEQVGQIEVETGVENADRLLSGWLLYQSLACRIFGRSSVYQSGGAYGFRDQLQDSTAVLAVNPEVTKNMLIEAAKHQFEEGDVMHWWHPSGIKDSVAKGVRTRCSDDLLFLPYVLCEYVEKTGDMSICDIQLPYITSAPLLEDEHERYQAPKRSELTESLFLHAKRAMDMVLKRGVGANGLCLMGTGDWNDGMNLVGAKGKGESVWLTWFFAHVLTRWADLCEKMDEKTLAETYKKQAKVYGKAADNAWDGDWYLRGYYDNGATLGSHKDEECQIDAIAQGWSAMTTHSDPKRVKKAIQSAAERLLDKENKLLQLFDPPFDKGIENPGYIRGYAPGLRENGGQYTHGVLWLSMGAFRAGLPDLGWEMLSAMLPGERVQSTYRGEPYVVAADVYANQQHRGRSGWTWYTGAAAWYFRVAMEEMLGLILEDGKLYIKPNLPAALERYRVRWGEWEIAVENGNITVNGKSYGGEGLAVFPENKQALPQIGKL